LNIGTWNVQGLLRKGQEVINKTYKIKMDTVAVTETKKGDRTVVVFPRM
jgi:exonuclease III